MTIITLYKQIHPTQCPSIAHLGYKTLINLRYDNETDGQPMACDITDWAQRAGMNCHHFPVDFETMTESCIHRFATLIKDSPSPIMVFCATGARAKRLYQSAVVLGVL